MKQINKMKNLSLRNMSVAIATLFIVMFAMPFMAKAQTKYDLEIAGVRVTSNNCNDLSVIEGVSGTVKYDPSSNTLTLDNATIDVGDDKNCIFAGKGAIALTIVVKGTCRLASTTWSSLNIWGNTTISGDGELYLESNESCSINLDQGATLTIDGCSIYAKGAIGISGFYQSSDAKLVIKNAFVTAEGTVGAICYLVSLRLEGCGITEPAGATFNESKHAVCDASGNITNKIVIKPTVKYDLDIAGVGVTSNNCNDLSVIEGVSGTVKYDPSSKILTLDNATIDVGDDKNCIFARKGVVALTIVVKGTCKLSSTTWSPLNIWVNTTISGDGELYLESKEGRINLDQGATLIIDRCRVDAKGESGISGFNESSNAKLVIKNATVTAEGTEGSIINLASLTLVGCEITEPAGAVFNESKHAVCDASGNIITNKIVIKPTVKYNLEIAGVGVTSDNCNDLSVIEGVSGTVKYDPSSKILTLENATIDVGDGRNCIFAGKGAVALTIVVKGTCKLSSTTWSPLNLWRNTTISGDGELYLESNRNRSINLDEGATLIIDRCRVDAKGARGISGFNQSSDAKLVIKNAFVTAEGTKGAICKLVSLTLEDCKITEPAGAAFNESKGAVCDADGNIITNKIVIKPTVKCDLDIAGVGVTSDNCDDLSVIDGVSGTAKYDPSSNTLTLEDATIDVGDGKNCIFARKGAVALTIVVKGTCKLSSTTWSPLNIWGNTTISGDGELYLESNESRSINLDQGATLIIDRCRVDAKGLSGISGFYQSSNAKLVIKNATVTAEGTEGSIINLASLTLEGCEITEPAGATFNESKYAVCDASGNITNKIVIKPTVKYNLDIAGVGVTSNNCNDLSVIDGVSGTVKYDPSSNTLTLDNATIDVGDDKNCIFARKEGAPLTIVVKGTCRLASTTWSSLNIWGNTTISGDGELYLESKEGHSINLDKGATLTIHGCSIYAKGLSGISGFYQSSDAKLVIKNAFVTAEGTEGSIIDLASLTLEGCKITEPAGAAFNESKHAVCDADGNVITNKIVIKPSEPDAIERISLEEPAYRGIYNLLGIKLNIPFEQLPSGVYIVDGVKVFKK